MEVNVTAVWRRFSNRRLAILNLKEDVARTWRSITY